MATSGSGVSKLGLYISTNTPWNKLPPSIKEVSPVVMTSLSRDMIGIGAR